uniref:Uncharacterized protein n=1 Tax=Rangifer tarandus platyrhynchus TaxID=3082113 RepID=A0ACB0EER9_RANTA|nr:unnamed protein product [Rangifer tarandus platyrhynchus]
MSPARPPVAWSSPAKVQGGAGPGEHEGVQGCFRPSRVPSGVSTVHWTPSTSSLPHGSYILMFTIKSKSGFESQQARRQKKHLALSEQTRVLLTCTLVSASVSFCRKGARWQRFTGEPHYVTGGGHHQEGGTSMVLLAEQTMRTAPPTSATPPALMRRHPTSRPQGSHLQQRGFSVASSNPGPRNALGGRAPVASARPVDLVESVEDLTAVVTGAAERSPAVTTHLLGGIRALLRGGLAPAAPSTTPAPALTIMLRAALGATPSPDKSAERVCLLTASARAATDALPGVIPPYPPRAPEASASPSGNLSDGASTSTRGVIFCPLSRALQSSEPFLGRLSMEPSRSAQEGVNQMDGTRAPGHLGTQGVPKSSEGLSSRGQRLLRDPTESPGALLSSESPEVCGNWRGSPSRGPHGSPVYTLTWLSPFSRGAWLTQVGVGPGERRPGQPLDSGSATCVPHVPSLRQFQSFRSERRRRPSRGGERVHSRRASLATAPLAWKSQKGAQRPFSCPLVSRQALGSYTRAEPNSGGGSLPPPWAPSKEEKSCCEGHSLVGHTWTDGAPSVKTCTAPTLQEAWHHGPREKAQSSSAPRGEGEPGSGPTLLGFTREIRMGQKILTFGHKSGRASNQPQCKRDAKTCDSRRGVEPAGLALARPGDRNCFLSSCPLETLPSPDARHNEALIICRACELRSGCRGCERQLELPCPPPRTCPPTSPFVPDALPFALLSLRVCLMP